MISRSINSTTQRVSVECLCIPYLRLGLFLFVPIICLMTGCGGEETGADEGTGSTLLNNDEPFVRKESVKRDGPKIDFAKDQSTPIDGQKASVSPPSGWARGTRRPDYEVWYQQKRGAKLPIVLIAAEEAKGRFADVDERNAIEFGKIVLQELKDDGKIKLLKEQEIIPVICGDRVCVRYVKRGILSGTRTDVQMLVTQVNGRRYTVELWVSENELQTYKYAGYSVMAGMEFSTGSGN